MNPITKTTNEFAQYLLDTAEFTELNEATKQMNANKEAQDLIEDVQSKKQTVMTMQQTGLPVSETQQQELQAAFTKMRANSICMRLIKAQNTAIQLARKICNQLTQETGIPFTSGSGCCG